MKAEWSVCSIKIGAMIFRSKEERRTSFELQQCVRHMLVALFALDNLSLTITQLGFYESMDLPPTFTPQPK